jgi:hypothetical protein
LRFDSDAEAIRAQGMLALKEGADRVETILRQGFHGEGAASATSLIVCAAQPLIYRVGMDQRVVVAERIVWCAWLDQG